MLIENFVHGLRTWIEIDSRALRHNVAVFRKLIRLRQGYGGQVGPRVRLMAVVKSNAYGHGLVHVAKCLSNDSRIASNGSRIDGFEKNSILFEKDSRKSLWFGVDSIDEALELRKSRIRNSILILGYALPERLTEAAEKRISVTISHFEGLRALARLKNRPAFHIKLDTGMHRQGFQEYEMPKLIAVLKKFRLEPQGVYSHFAAAENENFSLGQISAFERCLKPCTLFCGRQKMLRHLSATGGALYYPRAHYDMIRIGLGVYGYLPENRGRGIGARVRSVMTWKTMVSEIKRLKKGEKIGYGLTERLKRDSVVAILPIGYWHGFDRGLSSIGKVLVHGKRAKVLGRVSMDMTAVDITGIKNTRIGDEVALIGRQRKEFIGADETAKKLGTISYEVLTRVNPLIRRIIK